MILLGVVDRVLRNLHRHVLLRQDRLARQARVRLQTPGAVEQILFGFVQLAETLEALAHHHMAGGAGAAHVAGVLDLDVVFEQRFADGCAGWRADAGTLGAVFGMGKDFDRGHVVFWVFSDFFDFATRQGLLDAAVHALCGKRFGTLGQGLGGGFNVGGCVVGDDGRQGVDERLDGVALGG
jgi:hypothetical protein